MPEINNDRIGTAAKNTDGKNPVGGNNGNLQVLRRSAVPRTVASGDIISSAKTVPTLIALLIVSLVILLCLFAALSFRMNRESENLSAAIEKENSKNAVMLAHIASKDAEISATVNEVLTKPDVTPKPASYTENSKVISDINSEYAILIDLESNEVVASLKGENKIYPASMTKLMTLIVAVENMPELDALYTFTLDDINPPANAGASVAGFSVGETVPLRDVLYGAALPSGADATSAIAHYVAGSEEEFAVLMNKKAEELGLTNTHFVNASGLHDKNHYSTPHEIALIFEYSLSIPVLKEILSTYQYTTTATKQHEQGLLLTSTMFSRMRGDEPETCEVFAGKTGYTIEGRNCLASMASSKDGHSYILVTAYASGKYGPIYDAIDIYKKYVPAAEIQADAEN